MIGKFRRMNYAGGVDITNDRVFVDGQKVPLQDHLSTFGYQADGTLHLEKGDDSKEFKLYKIFWKLQKYMMAPHILF